MKKAQKVSANDKLTSWEWDGINEGINIADGHAHQEQNLQIVNRLSKLYLQSEKEKQKEIQHAFEKVFFSLAGQKSYKKLQPPLYQYACSLSIEVVANYLRLKNKSVALLHPTFDNLADILKRHSIPMTALPEEAVLDPEKKLKNINADAFFLVCPNNPTGFELTKKQFIQIVNYCRKNKKLLILDYSFRFYSNHTQWDQYDLLLKSGIDFIVLEDTGKTWPTLELKIGITVASDSLYSDLADITNDFLLNVSPFTFTLITEYIKSDIHNRTYTNAEKIVALHRKKLQQILQNTPLTLENPSSTLSVAWLKLPKGWTATSFCTWLKKSGVHVLPGGPFYWNDINKGESYIRIALLRRSEEFYGALEQLENATLSYTVT